jgi:hypothetical protein
MKQICFKLWYDTDFTKEALSMLPGFKNLTELIILNCGRGNIPFINVLLSCPNLSIFEYHTEHERHPYSVFVPLQI